MPGLKGFHQKIKAGIANNENIEIDVSDVAALPIAYVQLLIATGLSARSRGLTATLLNPSFSTLFAFESIGIDSNSNVFEIGYAAC